jgi:hypothetical protein
VLDISATRHKELTPNFSALAVTAVVVPSPNSSKGVEISLCSRISHTGFVRDAKMHSPFSDSEKGLVFIVILSYYCFLLCLRSNSFASNCNFSILALIMVLLKKRGYIHQRKTKRIFGWIQYRQYPLERFSET